MTFTNLNLYSSIGQLVELGGIPIAAILCLSLMIFILFFERLYFLCITLKRLISKLEHDWFDDQELSPWNRQKIREAILAEGIFAARRSLWLFKAAIVACPLLGLMGTVSGMILVFDQISLTGTGNPRAMASGIFQATLPTMAGMLISIIGLIMQYALRRLNLHSQAMLNTRLPIQDEAGAIQA